MNLRAALVFAGLLAAAAASWVASRGEGPEQAGETIVPASSAGYYVRDAIVRGSGDDGRFLYSIRAGAAAENPDGGTIELNEVAISYGAADEVPWQITADRGSVSDDLEAVTLSGNVIAESLGETPAALVTETLTVEPQRYRASTDARVTISVGERSISATGMLAFLDEDRIELRSNVRGRFLP
ncbi:MAG: LPS export ABC transporter periplasmic protein LptC [Pseudomonadota bacterium]